MGLAKRKNVGNAIAQSEIQRSLYSYTLSIDLDRVGKDGELEITEEEKADRVDRLLDAVHYLYRDIKGRRENLSPIFVIGGRYERKNPFFENRIRVDENRLNTAPLKEIMDEEQQIREHTFVGVMTGMFENEEEIRKNLEAATVGDAFAGLKKEVKDYYEGH